MLIVSSGVADARREGGALRSGDVHMWKASDAGSGLSEVHSPGVLLELLQDGDRGELNDAHSIRLIQPDRSRTERVEVMLHGMACEHKRMRYGTCGNPMHAGKPCFVKCPDCGFTWMMYEGVYG